jgi:hypothetical protein
MERIATVRCSVKCQSWLPTDHFERLLEKVCLNHPYPFRHKLKDYSMMKNFMISGSLPGTRCPSLWKMRS